MARSFVHTNPDYLSCAAPIIGGPMTVSVWVNLTSTAANFAVFALTNSSSNANNLLLYRGSDGNVYFFINGITFTNQSAAGATYTANVWQHYCGGYAGGLNKPLLWLNGTSHHGADYFTEIDPVGINTLSIGRRQMLSPDFPLSGKIAEIGLWNAVLTDAEVTILSKGISPVLVRSQSLVFYCPLVRNNDKDLIGGLSLSASGSPGIADHPRVILASKLHTRFTSSPPLVSSKSYGFIF